MSITREERVVAAHFAAKENLNGQDIQEFLAYFSDAGTSKLDEIQSLLARLNAPRLQRGLARADRRSTDVTAARPIEVDRGGYWHRNGETIGHSLQLYKPIQPYEMQARVAYDVFYASVFDILAGRYRIVVIDETDHGVKWFVPAKCDCDFENLWTEVVEELFSHRMLRDTFVRLMRSFKITKDGFGVIQVPIITRAQAEALAGFDLINVRSLMIGDEKRRRAIQALTYELAVRDLGKKEQEKLQAKLAETEKQLADRLKRYEQVYESWQMTCVNMPDWATAVESAEQMYASSAALPIAGQQILRPAAAMRKVAQQIAELGELVEKKEFSRLAPLLSTSPPSSPVLPGGDGDTKVCYSCGRAIAKKEHTYKANTLVFSAPSQRLQSRGSQKEPNVCTACAAVSFISPIKLGKEWLILRMSTRGELGPQALMPNAQLQMFVLGDLDIVAGHYAMLRANEKAYDRKLIIDKLGAVQYAIYKIATIFSSPTVFHEYEPEVIIGDTVVRLASRHVIWMQHLVDIFNLNRGWTDKSHFSALSRAIRYVQHDQIVHAVYELLRTSVISVQQINYIKSIQLEDLNASHWKELYAMTDKTKARFYQDIAAMTGLHYAFCRYIYSQTTDNDRRIAVRKAIERSDDPYQFSYTEASETKQVKAILRRDAASYFIYEQAGNLLAELNVDLEDRRSFADEQRQTLKLENQEATQLYIDDIIKAHTYLVENRYVTPKAQREFFYALKLSLHTRFPDLLERKKENE